MRRHLAYKNTLHIFGPETLYDYSWSKSKIARMGRPSRRSGLRCLCSRREYQHCNVSGSVESGPATLRAPIPAGFEQQVVLVVPNFSSGLYLKWGGGGEASSARPRPGMSIIQSGSYAFCPLDREPGGAGVLEKYGGLLV